MTALFMLIFCKQEYWCNYRYPFIYVGIFPKFILGHRNDLSAFKCPPYIICNSNNKIFPHPAYFINFV